MLELRLFTSLLSDRRPHESSSRSVSPCAVLGTADSSTGVYEKCSPQQSCLESARGAEPSGRKAAAPGRQPRSPNTQVDTPASPTPGSLAEGLPVTAPPTGDTHPQERPFQLPLLSASVNQRYEGRPQCREKSRARTASGD